MNGSITLVGIPVDFILFAVTLVGVAVFHRHTMAVALIGLGAIIGYQLIFTGVGGEPGLTGLLHHFEHEWVVLANLFLLLTGFAILSNHFEQSNIPDEMPALLPSGWIGGFALLAIVFLISGFLDNIAAALIGGTMARHVFHKKVTIGYLAAIVAASNAGGSWSVVGDTTTTMMWIGGVSPKSVFEASIGAGVALLVFGIPASIQQDRHAPIAKHPPKGLRIGWGRLAVVAVILATAILANVLCNLWYPALLGTIPVIGLAVWAVIVLTAGWQRPQWGVLPSTVQGTVFLLALVTAASMMPVESLPAASWRTAFGLGFVSAVFDNIPLTALALRQGGYDWGFLAYAVGFGGSMIWFGSSAGVALAGLYPEAKSVVSWVRHGWFVAVAYVVGFAALLGALGWHPDPHPLRSAAPPTSAGPAR
jgi:Na+/H+ antiporter NhaD/arsenite permease-like protein